MAQPSILVVDDEPFMRCLLLEYLEPEGYNVETAENGEVAWQKLCNATTPFDVLVTDRNMPVLDGVGLLKRIKADDRFTNLPVIFQTAYAAVDQVLEGISAGVYYYLNKPYDARVLVAVVKAALDDSQLYKKLRENTRLQKEALSLLWQGEFRFYSVDDMAPIATFLANLCENPERVVTGLSELLLNAVEHGNLGISYEEKSQLLEEGRWHEEVAARQAKPEYRDRFVSVQFYRQQNEIHITITDQGNGFSPHQYLNFDPLRATHAHGRGIAMARLMSFQSLEYLGCGNQVVAIARGMAV